MKTFVLMSDGYPLQVSNNLNGLFKGRFEDCTVTNKMEQSSIEDQLKVSDIVNILVTTKECDMFKSTTLNYQIHVVRYE